MKTSKVLPTPAVEQPQKGQPMPFTPDSESGAAAFADQLIEPAPPCVRRTLKARLHFRGRSEPIVITDPWE